MRDGDLDAVDDSLDFGIPQGIRLALKLLDLLLDLFVGLCHCLLSYLVEIRRVLRLLGA